MADIIADEHKHNRRSDSSQASGEKPNALSFGNPNGHCNSFGSLLGKRRRKAGYKAVGDDYKNIKMLGAKNKSDARLWRRVVLAYGHHLETPWATV
jgi:hypothetical protein